MAGLGYQEMIFNYLGSKKEFIDNMLIDASGVIEISNPMSENYQFVRPSIIASLLGAEAGSGNAVYPHKIFEVGKAAFLTNNAFSAKDGSEESAPRVCEANSKCIGDKDVGDTTGTRTIQSLGFLAASGTANFNDAASEVATLLYFLGHEYAVRESDDSRFVAGRQAEVLIGGKKAGVFGEVHPQVLENWTIAVPCVAGEINLEML
jgi:phenylalanyl-tRNA synthetase beta chain